MSTLVDPHVCPDCRAPLDAAATCTGCGLRLVGATAAELWQTMQRADRLVEQLRADSPSPAAPGPADLPAAPVAAAGVPARSALPSLSVPVVLLGLGGLCLLVAAVVFVAVAWGSLGLAAKTAILVVVTALFAAGAVSVTRRGLRLGAETLWVVVSGLVALDLAAAYGADLAGLGHLADHDAVGLVGAVLLALAVGVGTWVSVMPLRRLHGLVGVAAVGVLLLAGAEVWGSAHNPTAVAVSVPVLAVLALGIDRVSRTLRPTAVVVAGTAVVSWLALVGYGVDRMSTTATDAAWWSDLRGWPLLVAAALAAVPAGVPRMRASLGTTAAGGCLVTLALLGAGPATNPTADLVSWAGVTVAVAAVAAVAPTVWARAAAALSAVALLAWSSWALARPLAVVAQLPWTAPAERQRLGLHLPAATGAPAPWTAIVSVLVVGAVAAALLKHLPSAATRAAAGRTWIALGPGALALGAASGLLETEPRLLVAVLAWSGVLAVGVAMAVTVRDHPAPLLASTLFGAYLVAVGVRLTLPSHLLAAVLAGAAAVVLAVAYARVRPLVLLAVLMPALAAAAAVLAGFAAVHWTYVAGGGRGAAGLSLAGLSGVVLVGARAAGRDRRARLTLEVTGLALGLGATAFPTEATGAAMVLTVVGSAVAVVAVLNRDREPAAWIGVVLLGAATMIRLVEDVRAPEAYTLPAAALLLAAGWWRLGADRGASTARALSSGLTLALVPSLLLCLDDPVSLRGALVGAGGLAALAVGVVRHWAAPFVAGGLTTAALAVRHLGPVVEGLPRWISLGSVGLALLLVGVTWEQRRRDVEASSRYLTALR